MFVTSIPQFVQGLTNAKVDLTSANNSSAYSLYTVSSDSDFNAAIISSILVSNDQSSPSTITVTLVSGSDTFSVYKLEEVGALSTKELLSKDLIMQAGEILKVQAADNDRLHVVASIQEITKQRITTSALANI